MVWYDVPRYDQNMADGFISMHGALLARSLLVARLAAMYPRLSWR
jgi:hypothetical protein